jgi:hypothetical protein
MRARHRVSKLLLRHGIVYSGGKAWIQLHDRWLRQQRFDSAATQAAFDDTYDPRPGTVRALAPRRGQGPFEPPSRPSDSACQVGASGPP